MHAFQFIASAPTMFPPEYVEEFQNCFDRAPAVPFQEIQAILREELGRPIENVYEFVDPTPIASASIAQVSISLLLLSSFVIVYVSMASAAPCLPPFPYSFLSNDV